MSHFSKYQADFDALKCCVLIPTYNNDKTLAAVITSVLELTQNIVVVNDGSTDSTSAVLEKFSDIGIVHLAKNKGKGMALRTGFAKALELGYRYAITIDSDGQHLAGDLPLFLKAIQDHPGALIVGERNMNQPGVPGGSSFGHKFSNFWFKLETGIDLPDTQSGFRAYPLKPLANMFFFTARYEFEIEVLVRAAWQEIPVLSIPIGVLYPEDRVTHFRKVADFTRISLLNTVLVLLAFFYFIPARYVKRFKKKSPATFSASFFSISMNPIG